MPVFVQALACCEVQGCNKEEPFLLGLEPVVGMSGPVMGKKLPPGWRRILNLWAAHSTVVCPAHSIEFP